MALDFKQERHHFFFWLLKVGQQQTHLLPDWHEYAHLESVVKPPTVKLLTVKTSLSGAFTGNRCFSEIQATCNLVLILGEDGFEVNCKNIAWVLQSWLPAKLSRRGLRCGTFVADCLYALFKFEDAKKISLLSTHREIFAWIWVVFTLKNGYTEYANIQTSKLISLGGGGGGDDPPCFLQSEWQYRLTIVGICECYMLCQFPGLTKTTKVIQEHKRKALLAGYFYYLYSAGTALCTYGNCIT